MSNIIKCENCGCEGIDIIHKYKGYYVCPKCGRDTERLYEIEHDKEIRAKAIDEFVNTLIPRLTDAIYQKDVESMSNLINDVARELKAGEENEINRCR